MPLKNKQNISDVAELARVEEKLSKAKAKELFDSGALNRLQSVSFQALAEIHRTLFAQIYDFAGEIRSENMSKGNFRFASAMYLKAALKQIEDMPQSTFDEIVDKYIEMNIAHPFREGNGRSMRIWLDLMLKQELKQVVDWSRIDKNDYLLAMERSPIKNVEIKLLLQKALSDRVDDSNIYMKGIDASYQFEGYSSYKTETIELKQTNKTNPNQNKPNAK